MKNVLINNPSNYLPQCQSTAESIIYCASSKSLATEYFDQNSRSPHPMDSYSPRHPFSLKTHLANLQPSLNALEQAHLGFKNKQKRKTLPCQLPLQRQTHQIRGLLSPSHLASIQRKINFTYKDPVNNNSLSNLTTYSSSQYSRKQEHKMELQFSRVRVKKLRNKLCSAEFQFSYSPLTLNKIESCSYTFAKSRKNISFIEEYENSMKSINYNESGIKMTNQSNKASTIATQSFFNEKRSTDFSQLENLNKRRNTSEISLFNRNSNINLSDKIPTAKQLGQTVIIPNYTFGGIIEGNLFQSANQTVENRADVFVMPRQWNIHVKNLIESGDSDLKQSIHCGPEIRLERHKFDMLDGFGRDIKESTLYE